MNKNVKRLLKSTLIGLSFLSTAFINTQISEAISMPDEPISMPDEPKIIVTNTAEDGTIMSFRFNPKYDSTLNRYYNGREIYREVYYPENPNQVGGFVWYSIVPQIYVSDLSKTDLGQMYENRQTAVGHGGAHLVPGAGLNLKYGSIDVWTGKYLGDNTGTKTIRYGKYKGKKYEYRFIGYNQYGNAVGNPYFPADQLVNNNIKTKEQAGEYWKNMNWIPNSWKLEKSIKLFGYPDKLNNHTQKVKWIEEYFFKDYPAFKKKGNAEYWAQRLRPLTDPSKEMGVWIGFHKDSTGTIWYTQFITTPPAQNNLRLVKFEIRDKNGDLVAELTRNGTYNSNQTVTKKVYRQVSKGETLYVTAKVKNMKEQPKNIDNTKISLLHVELADDKVGSVSGFKWNEVIANSPHEKSLHAGEVATFNYQYTVDTGNKEKDYLEFVAQIPDSFYYAGYNKITTDDNARLILDIAPENLAVEFKGFYDANGNPIDYVTQDEPVWVKYKVAKKSGSKAVKDATLNIMLTDTKTVTTNETYKLTVAKNKSQEEIEDGILRNKGDYAVFWAHITPRSNKVCTQGSIPLYWNQNGYNEILSDDTTEKVCLSSADNIVVSNVVAKPKTVYVPNSESKKSVVYTVNYNLANYSKTKIDKDIPVVITIDGKVVHTEIVPVQAMNVMKKSVVLPPVTVGTGKHVIQVEANPKPRKYVENKVDSNGQEVDPYTDNVGWDVVNVLKNDTTTFCEVEHTSNTWNTEFTLANWHLESRWSCGEDDYCYSYTVTVWNYNYQTVGFYETHKIDHIFFKSKQTNNQWIDLKSGQVAPIKAGYGFEMKIVTSYETNTYNDTPKPYDYGTYGRLVSPQYTVVDSSSRVKVTMPFTDEYGQPVSYILNGTQEGTWYNNTKTYELESRVIIRDEERKIYVDKNTTDGEYPIRIETEAFYGSYDKPTTNQKLCDIEYVTLKVKGSYLDDVKTHIIQ